MISARFGSSRLSSATGRWFAFALALWPTRSPLAACCARPWRSAMMTRLLCRLRVEFEIVQLLSLRGSRIERGERCNFRLTVVLAALAAMLVPAPAARAFETAGQGGNHHRFPHRDGAVREERRRARPARVDEQADDRLYGVRPAQERPAPARRGGAGQRARLEDGRLADVPGGRRPGEGRGSDPRRHHPVRQRCLRDARRGHCRLRGGIRQADEREGAGARPDRQLVRELHRPRCSRLT